MCPLRVREDQYWGGQRGAGWGGKKCHDPTIHLEWTGTITNDLMGHPSDVPSEEQPSAGFMGHVQTGAVLCGVVGGLLSTQHKAHPVHTSVHVSPYMQIPSEQQNSKL